ncbi:hypothetical protein GCM10009716_43480 [Streptomyces sodiiphilus]|uniref:Uncharacterized protein n=1 Tax=Streptomyces sodiiphilus TaxID=226217 RepID=A0ABP5B8E9_9ACTN
MVDTVPDTAGPRTASRPDGPDLITVPVREGLEAVDVLRLRDGLGPVVHDSGSDTLTFLVPAGTSGHWDLPASVCSRAGAAARPCGAGRSWLVPPGAAGVRPFTDPARLRRALIEATQTLAVVEAASLLRSLHTGPGGGQRRTAA